VYNRGSVHEVQSPHELLHHNSHLLQRQATVPIPRDEVQKRERYVLKYEAQVALVSEVIQQAHDNRAASKTSDDPARVSLIVRCTLLCRGGGGRWGGRAADAAASTRSSRSGLPQQLSPPLLQLGKQVDLLHGLRIVGVVIAHDLDRHLTPPCTNQRIRGPSLWTGVLQNLRALDDCPKRAPAKE